VHILCRSKQGLSVQDVANKKFKVMSQYCYIAPLSARAIAIASPKTPVPSVTTAVCPPTSYKFDIPLPSTSEIYCLASSSCEKHFPSCGFRRNSITSWWSVVADEDGLDMAIVQIGHHVSRDRFFTRIKHVEKTPSQFCGYFVANVK
jgi:hypothetical protein